MLRLGLAIINGLCISALITKRRNCKFATHPFYARFAKRIAQDLALDTLAAIPSGVEAVEREDGTHRLLFLLNFAPKRQEAEITGHWEDLLTGRGASAKVTIEAFGIQLFAQTRKTTW